MRILITGVCGFVGSTLARAWVESGASHEIFGLDNLVRPGSESNRLALQRLGVRVTHGDLRSPSDLELVPPVDWVIDAAANPSVLAGVDGRTSSRQVVDHNLTGTINVLEFCRTHRAGFILLSTSRVYSIAQLAALRVVSNRDAFEPDLAVPQPAVSADGVSEAFSTDPPVSLYGATKRASELLALEYGEAFDFPVWINRCGVLAGGGQFARIDQGIFAYWIHSWRAGRPLAYLGFAGHQVRDCLHPRDLVPLLDAQMIEPPATTRRRVQNVSGGTASACSLKQCSDWCADRFGARDVESSGESRRYDVPWLVLDSGLAHRQWNWAPRTSRETVFDEIARHAEAHPEWLELSRSW